MLKISALPLSAMLEFIQQQCKQKNWISFADFMQHALYHPQWGYYCKPQEKFGAQGDFITAPSQSPLFSQCMAHFCLQHSPQHILELGPGNGQMANEIIAELKKHHSLPEKYFLYDVSPSLRQTQQTLLKQAHPDYFENIIWLEELDTYTINGILLANEVIDSLPMHRFHIDQDFQILEQGISIVNDTLALTNQQPQSPGLSQAVDALMSNLSQPLPPGYTSEIHLHLAPWLENVCQHFTGHMVFIDYGFLRKEFYHWQRYQGTLMCHYQHQAHDDPLKHIGNQDITAHVDFEHLAECAQRFGFNVTSYDNQANFLMHHGLMDLAQSQMQTNSMHHLSQQINMLTAPHEMGELFKVMVLDNLVQNATGNAQI